MLVEDLDVVARVFLGGKGVHLTADRIDRLGDILRRSRSRSLEEHVLDEVRDPALLLRFVAGTAGQPHADAYRADMRHPLRKKTEPIRQHLADDR